MRFGEEEVSCLLCLLLVQIAVSEFHNNYVIYGLRNVRYRIGKSSRLQLNGVLVRFYMYTGWDFEGVLVYDFSFQLST